MKKKEFVTQDLLSKIYQQSSPPLNKLPPERQLAEEYGVSRFTIRQALEKLVSIGVINVVQGSGIYISERARSNPLVYNSITEKRFDQIAFRLISLHKKLPDKEERQVFGLGEHEYIWQFCRVRYVDNQRVQIETSKLPFSDFPDLNQQIIESSIQQYVLGRGLQISHLLTSYQAISIDKQQAALLACKRGQPAMQINSRGILAGGRVFEISEVIDINYSCTYVIPFNQDNLSFRQTHP
ncbi:GntR family transcriptional regulator [Erwiniaceae bacterium BAC15a-03b]|uniref:GntR family transcriptional regulator n=1 Tax=Winslowiella arboricola TaxID=2978220 RepID=A0A9J6PPC5_9GAMM|nr:GntR family transcriptional regulator [Winslowiella arboricola]MCU5774703.1 GntR family transcriptional regulator [Winslowiella arboricola]MCU5780145.1 GntR family transcriptional regulator [Winslowiella arboricola]